MTVNALREIERELYDKLDDPELVSVRVVLALFCKCDPTLLIEPTLHLLEDWKGIAGANLKWAMVGPNASALSAIKDKTYARIDREIRSLEAGEMSSFRVLGPTPYAPDFRLNWFVLAGIGSEKFKDTSLIELTLPLPEDDAGWKNIARLLQAVSERFPYDTGYASPALLFSDDASKSAAGEIIGPLALRHHGLDVPNNESTCYALERLSRGARWLTVLSKENASKVDISAIENDPASLRVQPTSNGVLISASDMPEVGDTNRRVEAPGLKAVARHIEPITFFDDVPLCILFRDDLELTARWERRFFDY